MSNVSEGINALRQLSKAAKGVAVKRLAALDVLLAELTNLENVAKQFEERSSKAKRDAKAAETKMSTVQSALDSAGQELGKRRQAIDAADVELAGKAKDVISAAKKEASDILQVARRQKSDIDAAADVVRKEVGEAKHDLQRTAKEHKDLVDKIQAVREQARAALK